MTQGDEEVTDDVATPGGEEDEEKAVQLMAKVRARALLNIGEAQQRQKRNYDRRAVAIEVCGRLIHRNFYWFWFPFIVYRISPDTTSWLFCAQEELQRGWEEGEQNRGQLAWAICWRQRDH